MPLSKENTVIELNCASVAGGWQTAIKNTEVTFGPVFNRIQDLWAWQRANVYAVQKAEEQ
jgi:hypothetical protein